MGHDSGRLVHALVGRRACPPASSGGAAIDEWRFVGIEKEEVIGGRAVLMAQKLGRETPQLHALRIGGLGGGSKGQNG